jgi:autotransporter translocation and assembly factor TamB
MSKVIKKIGKILLHSLSGVVLVAILLILGVAIALSLPRVQSFVASKAVDFLSEKTSTHLAIDAISIENLSKICVEGLYIEDLQGDTLLYFSKVRGTIDRSALFSEGKLLPSNIEGERGVMNLVTLDNEEDDNLTQLIDQIASKFPASEE